MPDRISSLCSQLISAPDGTAAQPVAAKLQSAISRRVEHLREDALLAFARSLSSSPQPADTESGL